MGQYSAEIITDEQYKEIISAIRDGYLYRKPNLRAATILQIAFNTGADVSEIIEMEPNCIYRADEGVILFHLNEKTYVMPQKISKLIEDYHKKKYGVPIDYSSSEKIFGKITPYAIWKVMRQVTEYLEYKNVSPRSFRKRALIKVFEESNYNDDIVYEFLQQKRSQSIDDILSSIDGKERKTYGNIRV